MYQLTLTSLRYGETTSWEYFYAKDDNQLAEMKNHLFSKENITEASIVEYSINNDLCEPEENWTELYYTFDKSKEVPKWAYTLVIKPIKFGV